MCSKGGIITSISWICSDFAFGNAENMPEKSANVPKSHARNRRDVVDVNRGKSCGLWKSWTVRSDIPPEKTISLSFWVACRIGKIVFSKRSVSPTPLQD